jgi:hypothetical protein
MHGLSYRSFEVLKINDSEIFISRHYKGLDANLDGNLMMQTF